MNIAVAVVAPLTYLLIAVPAIRAQDVERIYKVGERVDNALVERPTVVHKPAAAGFSACRLNSKLRSVRVKGSQLINTDGNVRSVSIQKVTEVWIADGDGKTLIDESDPRWKDFAPAIETFKKQVIEQFNQYRYKPGTLRGEPVPVQSEFGVTTSW